MGRIHHPSRPVNGQRHVPLVARRRQAAVHTDAHPHRRLLRPRLRLLDDPLRDRAPAHGRRARGRTRRRRSLRRVDHVSAGRLPGLARSWRWRSKTGAYSSPRRLSSRVEPSMSVNTNVTTPDGSGTTADAKTCDEDGGGRSGVAGRSGDGDEHAHRGDHGRLAGEEATCRTCGPDLSVGARRRSRSRASARDGRPQSVSLDRSSSSRALQVSFEPAAPGRAGSDLRRLRLRVVLCCSMRRRVDRPVRHPVGWREGCGSTGSVRRRWWPRPGPDRGAAVVSLRTTARRPVDTPSLTVVQDRPVREYWTT